MKKKKERKGRRKGGSKGRRKEKKLKEKEKEKKKKCRELGMTAGQVLSASPPHETRALFFPPTNTVAPSRKVFPIRDLLLLG